MRIMMRDEFLGVSVGFWIGLIWAFTFVAIVIGVEIIGGLL